MSAKYEVVDKNKVTITVDVEAEKFEAAIRQSFEKNKNKFRINGFRPGKAPMKMVEEAYGVGAFYDGAFNYIIPREYDAAVKELGLRPVSEPEFDVTEVEGKTKLVFTATIYTMPEVKLGDYKGIEIKKIDTTVTDEDVENELKKMAEEDFRLVSVTDRPAANGDTVVIDYKGSVDGEYFEGGTAENHNLVLGSGSFIPGFEDQLVGANVNDEVKVEVTFPEEYHAKELAGKAAIFEVVVHEIKTKEIPEINDDFAAEKSDFDTLDEYKASLKEEIAKRKADEAKNKYEVEAIEKVTENAELDVPECMNVDAANRMIENYRQQITNYGIKFDDYLAMTGKTMDELMADVKPNAEKMVRQQLVLEAITAAEALKPTDEQLTAHLKDVAKQYGVEYEKMMEDLTDDAKEYFAGDMNIQLAVDFIVANATYAD